jgi:hypothetical protein
MIGYYRLPKALGMSLSTSLFSPSRLYSCPRSRVNIKFFVLLCLTDTHVFVHIGINSSTVHVSGDLPLVGGSVPKGCILVATVTMGGGMVLMGRCCQWYRATGAHDSQTNEPSKANETLPLLVPFCLVFTPRQPPTVLNNSTLE